MGWGLLIALLISLLVFYLLFHFLRRLMPLVLNGLIGVALFWAVGELGLIKVPIDILTFLIAAFGGAFGVIVVLILAWIGVPL
ncbi:MAG: pro-sigmaK processing inhibitor BofA family protein [Candidatus Micrarchaeota archaeon]|nr:pro-sigmaK processing inhibitor BofA family protein [Candidatus Micrarchaeota archaeon]